MCRWFSVLIHLINETSRQFIMWAATSDNVPLDMCAKQKFRSAPAHARSESSLGVFWIAKDAKFLHADNKESDQTARMHRLFWAFVWRKCQKVLFLTVKFRWSGTVKISHTGWEKCTAETGTFGLPFWCLTVVWAIRLQMSHFPLLKWVSSRISKSSQGRLKDTFLYCLSKQRRPWSSHWPPNVTGCEKWQLYQGLNHFRITIPIPYHQPPLSRKHNGFGTRERCFSYPVSKILVVTDSVVVFFICSFCFRKRMSHNLRKRTFPLVSPTKTQISLRSRAVWSESSLSAGRNCILRYPESAHWRFWSDCANAQADLNLHWAHMPKSTLPYVAAQF